jgi:transcriptional regulator with XRE-family HTH domain
VNELLVLLGKRIHDLRAAKKWSQEEFAHISGLHRTYIGQIERGEKNISFENLSKVAGVLGLTLSELLAGLEDAEVMDVNSKLRTNSGDQLIVDDTRRMLEIHKMVARLRLQRDAMDRTLRAIEDLTQSGFRGPANVRGASRRTRVAKK